MFCLGEEEALVGGAVDGSSEDCTSVDATAATASAAAATATAAAAATATAAAAATTTADTATALQESKQRLLAALDYMGGEDVARASVVGAGAAPEAGNDDAAMEAEPVKPTGPSVAWDATAVPPASAIASSSAIASFAKWKGAKCHQPTTAILLQFDQVLTQRLLTLHCDWLQDSNIDEGRGQWLYGLLARLEKPLYQDAAAVVRSLYRRSCELRACIDEDSGTFDTDIAALNVLISISGTYFRQADCIGNLDPMFEAMLLDEGEFSDSSSDGDSDSDSDRDIV